MLTPQQIQEARKKINITSSGAPTGSNLLSQLQAGSKPNYAERVGADIKQGFQNAKADIKSNDGRSNLSKGLSAVSNVAGGLISPITEAPGIKQVGELANKGIQRGGEELSKIFSPEFRAKLGSLSDEEFNTIAQPIQDIVNTGNIANTLLIAKGGQKGAQVAKEGAVKTGEGIANTAGKVAKSTKKVVGEVVPSADRIVNHQVSKALDLTASDVKNINLSTGNEVGAFLADKNLIRGNKVETTKALQDFFDTNYKTVRDEIGKVNKKYSAYNVPAYTQSLKAIKNQVDNVPGLEKVSVEVENLLNKKKSEITLNDVQKVKELLDEHFSLYKVTGDVKEGVAKEGLSNMRSQLKDFIEKEVKQNTGADIKTLNNEVSTAKSTLNAIEERSTKGLTSSNIKIGDLGTFGVGSVFGGPLVGMAALVAKKVMETSAVRLKFAKWLDGVSDARKLQIKEELLKGNVPDDVKKVLNQSQPKPKAISKKTIKKKASIS